MPKRRAGSSPVPGTTPKLREVNTLDHLQCFLAGHDFSQNRGTMAKTMAYVGSSLLFPQCDRFNAVLVIDDVVSLKHLSRFPATHLHDDRFSHARPAIRPCSRAPEVVNEQTDVFPIILAARPTAL